MKSDKQFIIESIKKGEPNVLLLILYNEYIKTDYTFEQFQRICFEFFSINNFRIMNSLYVKYNIPEYFKNINSMEEFIELIKNFFIVKYKLTLMYSQNKELIDIF